MLFLVWLGISDLYLFHLILFHLNLVLNCSKSLLSPWVDKVTTSKYNFMFFILNVAFVGLLVLLSPNPTLAALLVITQFSVYVKIRLVND